MPKLAELLALAFEKDPFYVYITPDPAARMAVLRWWMTVFLRHGLRRGEVHLTGTLEDPTGVAIWLGPKSPVPSSFWVAWSGLILGPFKMGWKGFVRMFRTTDAWQKLHRQERRPHWYLNFLAVHPRHQGRGLGRTLIGAVSARADSAGLHCYLETCTEINVRIYRRSGFEVVARQEWDGDQGRWASWTMRRAEKG